MAELQEQHNDLLKYYACYIDSHTISNVILQLFHCCLGIIIYYDFLNKFTGIRTWGVCASKNSSLEWETSSTNIKARFALLAYMGAEI